MKPTHIFLLALALAMTACVTPVPTGAPQQSPVTQPRVGDSFSLRAGQSITFSDAPVTVTFLTVKQDSRCPKSADCIRAGDVTASVQVTINGGESRTVSLTWPGSTENPNTESVGAYAVTLNDVQPYPETPDNPIRPEAYSISLVVNRR